MVCSYKIPVGYIHILEFKAGFAFNDDARQHSDTHSFTSAHLYTICQSYFIEV